MGALPGHRCEANPLCGGVRTAPDGVKEPDDGRPGSLESSIREVFLHGFLMVFVRCYLLFDSDLLKRTVVHSRRFGGLEGPKTGSTRQPDALQGSQERVVDVLR